MCCEADKCIWLKCGRDGDPHIFHISTAVIRSSETHDTAGPLLAPLQQQRRPPGSLEKRVAGRLRDASPREDFLPQVYLLARVPSSRT